MDHDLPTPRVAVVGGGVTGLVAAIRAASLTGPGTVTVLEPRPLGGRARTDHRGGFTFNRGPRALYRGGAADRILGELGVPVRSGGRPGLLGAGAVLGGGARRFALGGGEPTGATRALGLVLRGGGADAEGRTLAGWIRHRGLPPSVGRWVEALVRVATYADAPDLLPAQIALAQARAANRYGVQYLDGGFGSIVESLAAMARRVGVQITPAGVRAVRAAPDGRVELTLDDHRRICADFSVMCVGSPSRTAALLDDPPAAWSRLGPPAEVACLELGVRGRPRYPFLLGVDVPTYLSQHAPPASLAPRGHRVVHVMRYLPIGGPDVGTEPAALREELHHTAALAGIGPDAIVEERFLARMTTSSAIPTTSSPRPGVVVEGVPGTFVAGDWVGDGGLLLDAAVSSAAAAGRCAGEQSSQRSATMALP